MPDLSAFDEMAISEDEEAAVEVLYLSFSNAFDMVSHSILVLKVRCCGQSGWTAQMGGKLAGYPAQRVVVNGSSPCLDTTYK